jgi:hypothetical protein
MTTPFITVSIPVDVARPLFVPPPHVIHPNGPCSLFPPLQVTPSSFSGASATRSASCTPRALSSPPPAWALPPSPARPPPASSTTPPTWTYGAFPGWSPWPIKVTNGKKNFPWVHVRHECPCRTSASTHSLPPSLPLSLPSSLPPFLPLPPLLLSPPGLPEGPRGPPSRQGFASRLR